MESPAPTYQKSRADSGSTRASDLRSKFENMARAGDEDIKRRAEDEKKRRLANEQKEREESKRVEEVGHSPVLLIFLLSCGF